VVQPDLLFISEKQKEIITDNGVEGVPDLVVEILSPSSMRFDRGGKMKLYKNHKVQEYWIVDPKNQSIEIYVNENNEYELFSFAVESGKVESKVLQKFTLAVEQIF
jgi:Uma2 family endonuclease